MCCIFFLTTNLIARDDRGVFLCFAVRHQTDRDRLLEEAESCRASWARQAGQRVQKPLRCLVQVFLLTAWCWWWWGPFRLLLDQPDLFFGGYAGAKLRWRCS